MMGLSLTWNFSLDYTREAVRQMHPDLAELVEELIPFTSNFMHNLVTILDEDDLKAQKQWSETTIHERYSAAKE